MSDAGSGQDLPILPVGLGLPSQLPGLANIGRVPETLAEQIDELEHPSRSPDRSLDSLMMPRKSRADAGDSVLPGVIDALGEGPDRMARIGQLLLRAPLYTSRQIQEICEQAEAFAEISEAGFEETELGVMFDFRLLERFVLLFEGFKEKKPPKKFQIELPALYLHLIADYEAKVSHSSASSGRSEFKIEIAGFGGGKGRSKKIKTSSGSSSLKGNSSAQCLGIAKLRIFENSKKEIIRAVEIDRVVGPAAYFDDSSDRYATPPEVEANALISRLGGETNSDGAISFGIEIERGAWMDFGTNVDVSNIFPGISGTVVVKGRSECLSSIQIEVSVPPDKLLYLKGPHEESLRMFLATDSD
ncbi:MAG: hypothetical protein AAFW97_14295 [Pseudomonadota bacterium]